jgi:hypothetical protein
LQILQAATHATLSSRDNLVMHADSARLLPGNVTISAVSGSYWSADRERLHAGFHIVCVPDSDSLNPEFQHTEIIGVGAAAFADPTATLILEACSRTAPSDVYLCHTSAWHPHNGTLQTQLFYFLLI